MHFQNKNIVGNATDTLKVFTEMKQFVIRKGNQQHYCELIP